MERGTDASGYATINKAGHISGTARPMSGDRFTSSPAYTLPKSARTAILHTRLATQGSPKNPLNNHPVYSYCTDGNAVALVHNGCIDNDYDLFAADTALYRCAEVDSEILPALLALHGSEDFSEVFGMVEGSVACAWYDERQPDTLFVARSCSSPVEVAHIKTTNADGSPLEGTIFASTPRMLTAALATVGLTLTSPGVTHLYLTEGSLMRVVKGEWDTYVTPFPKGTRTTYRSWESYRAPSTQTVIGGKTSKSTTPGKNRSAGSSRYSEGFDADTGTIYSERRAMGESLAWTDEDLHASIEAWEARQARTIVDAEIVTDETDERDEYRTYTYDAWRDETHRCAYEAEAITALTEGEFETFIEHMEYCDPDSCAMSDPGSCPVMQEGRVPSLWEIDAVINAYAGSQRSALTAQPEITAADRPASDRAEITATPSGEIVLAYARDALDSR